jgi:predicted nucleic acid-binding protein
MRIIALDEQEAMVAGNLLLAHRNVPIADALIASFVRTGAADYVVTYDPHYKTLGVKTKWF